MAATPATIHEETVQTLPPPAVRTSFWSLTRLGFGLSIFLLLVGLVSLWYFSGEEDHFVDADAKRVQYREKVLADRVSEDQKYLNDQPSWFAKDKGLVRVPIQTAIEMTIPKLLAVKPHPAYPLTQSPPQPAAAPTSPDKGGGTSAPGNNAVNPPASNPTVGQPSPAAVAPAPTAAPVTSASSPAPGSPAKATAVPTAAPTPATTGAPAPAQGASVAPAPAATPTPAPAATPASAVKEVPSNNANNPGNAPIPGTSVQPPAPTPAVAQPLTPNNGAKPEPNSTPEVQPSPVGNAASVGSTPTPAPAEPGATPGGTPR